MKTLIRFQLNFVNGPAAQDCPILFRTTHDLAPPILQHTQNTSLSRKTPSPVAPSAPLPSMAPEPTDVLADEDKNTHLEEQSHKPDRSTAIFTNHRAQATTSKAPTTSQTELEGRVRLPWVEGESMLGFGFDALTGEFKVNSVFNHPVNLVETSKTAQSEIVIEHLKWQQVKEFQDEFEISVGATVNVPFPRIGANAKIAKILSENTAVSRIIMQYTVNVSFSAEYISDADVQLKEELHNLDPLEFRARYGDYYIAGYQRGYSCRVIAVCQTTEKTVTERLEREAKIFVENCFTGKLGSDRSKLATETFSLLTFEVHTEGCLLDTANMAGADIQEKVMQLKQSNHAGVERIAFLNHYSTLRRNLSRRLHVSGEMFHRAHVMRDAYAYLRMCRLHPALQEFYSDRRALDEVLKDFEKHRKDLVQMTQDEQRTRTIDALHQNLHSSKNTVETYIQRYDFMSTVTNMDKRIIAHDPTVIDGSDLRYRWECGKTGGVKKGGEPESPSVVCFGGHDAFEITWKSPWAPGHRIRRERVDMTFSTRYDHDIPVRPPNPNLKSKKPPVEAIHPGAYDYHLANQGPVFILGWQLSCSWPRNRGKPTIKAGHPLNHILSDQLRISVDISRATQWECKVTYVEKSSHDFPQLMPPRGQ
ncbi:hypothetical protein C8R46DRAFT_255617 [Mycena filopes]|nr:hypothetical protein C8R46DRAFT_255617 [Mycena filopes]